MLAQATNYLRAFSSSLDSLAASDDRRCCVIDDVLVLKPDPPGPFAFPLLSTDPYRADPLSDVLLERYEDYHDRDQGEDRHGKDCTPVGYS